MEYFLQNLDQWSWLIKLGAVVTAAGIIWNKVISPAFEFIKKVKSIVDNLEGAYPVIEDLVNNFSVNGKCILNEKFNSIEKDMWLRRERHRIYMELDGSAVFETTDEGQCTWVSEKWMELFDQNIVEASGHGWLAGVNSLDRDKVTHEWTTALSQKRQFKMKFRVRENGKAIWVQCSALPIKDAKNTTYGYIGKIVEIPNKQPDFSEVIK